MQKISGSLSNIDWNSLIDQIQHKRFRLVVKDWANKLPEEEVERRLLEVYDKYHGLIDISDTFRNASAEATLWEWCNALKVNRLESTHIAKFISSIDTHLGVEEYLLLEGINNSKLKIKKYWNGRYYIVMSDECGSFYKEISEKTFKSLQEDTLMET